MHFLDEKFGISILILLKFVHKGLIDNNSVLVQAMAWRRTGNKPLPEPILTSSPTHICGNWGRCAKLTISRNELQWNWFKINNNKKPFMKMHVVCKQEVMFVFASITFYILRHFADAVFKCIYVCQNLTEMHFLARGPYSELILSMNMRQTFIRNSDDPFCWHPWDDDVIKWKHFPRYWPFVRGNPRSPVNSPHKAQWHGALTFSLICAWINRWVNNREAGDLKRHCAHYDVIVMDTTAHKHTH